MRPDQKPWTEERRAEARELYEAGGSLHEVAATLGSSAHRVAEAIRAAGGTVRGRGAPMQRNGFWKNGSTRDKHGYLLLKVPGHPHANSSGYVREHRLVVEQVIGRFLEPEEVVHHLNGDEGDNRPENLELFPTNGSHLAHELKGRCPNWSPEGRAKIEAQYEARRSAPKLNRSREENNARAREWYALRTAARKAQTREPT
jgi:hypothetical protein